MYNSSSSDSVVIPFDFFIETDCAHLIAKANQLKLTYLITLGVSRQNKEDILKGIQNIEEKLSSQDISNLDKLLDEQKILEKDQERFSNEIKTLKAQIIEILHEITQLSWVFHSDFFS